MSTLVMVHGAWQTASTWDLVAARLREAGHAVMVPPLTGLENDPHVLSPDICLSTHVDDVIQALTREDLHDVTLIGHSYAGMVITGVAEQAPRRLKRSGGL